MSFQRTVTNVMPGAARRGFNGVLFTVGDESGGNVISVTLQLLEQTNPVAQRTVFTAFVSDNEDGNGLGAAPNGSDGVADGGHGHILNELIANRLLLLETDDDGRVQLNITQTGVSTKYLAVADSNGRVIVSPAITFA